MPRHVYTQETNRIVSLYLKEHNQSIVGVLRAGIRSVEQGFAVLNLHSVWSLAFFLLRM